MLRRVLFQSLLLCLLVAVVFLFSSNNNVVEAGVCGTESLPDEDEAKVMNIMSKRLGTRERGQLTYIRMYWHMIHDGTAGLLTESQVQLQIEALNDAFRDSMSTFRFNLVEITYTDNERWHNVDDGDVYFEMASVLREGDCATANIYSLDLPDNGMTRYFPWELRKECQGEWADDGIWINFDTIPTGEFPYNEGRTLAHQFGHWLGLYHTFENGCGSPGDYIDDTPGQSDPTEDCPSPVSSCSGDSGEDLDNYMDFNEDLCISRFTDGQRDWMWTQYWTFREEGMGNTLGGEPCFSPDAMAVVKQKGNVPMKDLQVGDEVLTASGTYQPVFTINHYHSSQSTNYLQIYTDLIDEGPLELSPNHLVFVQDRKDPIPAAKLQKGDFVQTLQHGPLEVRAITTVQKDGLYNPITTDGTMIVDGIMASSYTSFTGGSHYEIAGIKLLSDHSLLHMTIAPYRAFCMATSSLNICNQHGEGELPLATQLIEQFYQFLTSQHAAVQFVILTIYVFIFGVLNLVLSDDCIYYCTSVVVGVISWMCLQRRRSKKHS